MWMAASNKGMHALGLHLNLVYCPQPKGMCAGHQEGYRTEEGEGLSRAEIGPLGATGRVWQQHPPPATEQGLFSRKAGNAAAVGPTEPELWQPGVRVMGTRSLPLPSHRPGLRTMSTLS